MATTGAAPIPVTLGAPISGVVPTNALLAAMLNAHAQVSDLIFSPGRLPQVELHGQLVQVQAKGLMPLTADDTRRIAADLIDNNKQAVNLLREQGFCDVSYGLAGTARFRVNVFIQRGSCAVVMRVIPTEIPHLSDLGLPPQLEAIAELRDGIVLVSGPRASGKSSTLAALVDAINQRRSWHIITVEDPIEFLHNHKRCTIHQRELHSDTPSFALGLNAAMRQSPQVILVSELRDRRTMEIAIEAAETGHLVLSSLNAIDAAKTVERAVGMFSAPEQGSARARLAKTLRYVISQRLLPRRDGSGRIAAVEILRLNPRVRTAIEREAQPGPVLLQAMRDGASEGMQSLDCALEKLVRAGCIDPEIALSQAPDSPVLSHAFAHASEIGPALDPIASVRGTSV